MSSPAQQAFYEAMLLPRQALLCEQRGKNVNGDCSGSGSLLCSHFPTCVAPGIPLLLGSLSYERYLSTLCCVVWPTIPVFLGLRGFSGHGTRSLGKAPGKREVSQLSCLGQWWCETSWLCYLWDKETTVLWSVFLKVRFQSRDEMWPCIGSGQLGNPGLWITPAVPTLRELLIPTVTAHFSFPALAPCVFIGCAGRAVVTFPTKSIQIAFWVRAENLR